jgi:succinoglycan biosynthesis transport protein ExoP
MLQDNRSAKGQSNFDEWDSDSSGAGRIDIDRMLAIVHRQWRLVAICIIVFVVLGLAYLLTAVPRYTASADVMIDQNTSKIADQLSVMGGGLEDEAAILSQVELLKSERIALAVVDKLDLSNDATFMASSGAPVARLKALIMSAVNVGSWFASDSLTQSQIVAKRRMALARVIEGLDVSRVGRTYVLEILYTSPSPELAARIAQAVAEAYLTDQLDSKYDATRRASDWLQARIAELRQKSLDTDLAVQKFKSEKGLISAGGQLVSEQKLSELNSALIVAQSDTSRTKARYERIKSIVDARQTDAIVTDALDSSVINTLRAKYLDASKRESEISARLGPEHAQAVRLRGEMDEYKRLMFEELGRIAESYQSDYKVAQDREDAIRSQVEQATGASATDNETQVQLRELERESETYKNLYQTFLQRYQEAIQQQSFPVTDARIISRAAVPAGPSSPKRMLVLAISVMLGGLFGTGIGAFREFRERFFRTGDQVRGELGLEFLGVVPLVNAETRPPATRSTMIR